MCKVECLSFNFGKLLFNFYLNDLPVIEQSNNKIVFSADDTSLKTGEKVRKPSRFNEHLNYGEK